MAGLYLAIIAALIGIDQIFKELVVRNIAIGESIPTIKIGSFEIFNLNHVLNNGAGWSILSGKTLFLIIFTSIILIIGVLYFIKNIKKHPMLTASLILLISGGIGNLIDRIFRGGYVVDYIETAFIDFPIFNFADICVVFGAILLIIYTILFDKPEKTHKTAVTDNSDE